MVGEPKRPERPIDPRAPQVYVTDLTHPSRVAQVAGVGISALYRRFATRRTCSDGCAAMA